jgi:nitrous oxidase accessory protein NosD
MFHTSMKVRLGAMACAGAIGIATVGAALGVGAPAAQAAVTLTVDDDHAQCPAAAYTTIQSAVNAAGPGDTINVCRGTYNESVTIGPGKDGLSLVSSTAALAAIVRGNVPFIVSGAQGVSIQRFRLEPATTGILVGFSSGTALIRSNLVVGGANGMFISGAGGTIRDNTLLQQSATGLALQPLAITEIHTEALNNRITGPGGTESAGISVFTGFLSNMGSVTVFGNTVSEHVFGILATSTTDPAELLVSANTLFRNQVGLLLDHWAARVENNRVNENTGAGIRVSAFGARLLSNNARANGGTDCFDQSSGPGTAGTANFWTGNHGLESNPAGICTP